MANLFILIIIGMRILQSIFSKKAAMLLPDGLHAYVSYIGISNVISTAFAVLAIILSGDLGGFNGQMLLIAMCSGCFLALNSFCGIKALLGGTLVLNSIFGTAGLIIPCVLGIFVFDEPVSLLQCICIAAVFAATVLLIGSAKDIRGEFKPQTLLYLLLSFFSNGMVMFCQKLFGFLQPQGNVSMFSMFTFLMPALALMCALPSLAKTEGKAEGKRKLGKKLILCASVLAFAVFVIQQLVTYLTPLMSSALLFTLVNGSATVIAAIIGAAMYKEKLTPKSICGVILGIGAMIVMKSV